MWERQEGVIVGFPGTGNVRPIARRVGEEQGRVHDGWSRESPEFQAVPLLWILAVALQGTGVMALSHRLQNEAHTQFLL